MRAHINAEDIAKIAHEVNRAYCFSMGDHSQSRWEDAPEWQRTSAINGVKHHLKHPDTTPEESHQLWLKEKLATGWAYGPVKDEKAKTHPCCVPYDQLSPSDKAKDFLFRAVVRQCNLLEVELGNRAAHDERVMSMLGDGGR